jgi:lysozyme
MILSEAGRAAIENREGLRLEAYKDSAGLWTIGYGHLLTKDELRSGKVLGVDWRNGITPATADALLAGDVYTAADAISEFVRVPLLQNQFDALVSFVFNIGDGAFQDSTLLRLLNTDHFAEIPAQMRRWIHSAGQVDPGLVTRREDEVKQWEGTP